MGLICHSTFARVVVRCRDTGNTERYRCRAEKPRIKELTKSLSGHLLGRVYRDDSALHCQVPVDLLDNGGRNRGYSASVTSTKQSSYAEMTSLRDTTVSATFCSSNSSDDIAASRLNCIILLNFMTWRDYLCVTLARGDGL